MGAYTLRLLEDDLRATTRLDLEPTPRVLYVSTGDVVVSADGHRTVVAAEGAWHGAAACSVAVGPSGATILRYELLSGQKSTDESREAGALSSRLLLAHELGLDDRGEYLVRCDRVDFAPGGEALPHRHLGAGIRCLIDGELEVRIGSQPARVMKPGEAWFESGVEPVHAIASATTATSFIRVSVLPRRIRGQSSIVYVDPAHAAVKPRKYTVFVDEPIALP